MADSKLQECADCADKVAVETRKGARDGRWLCTPCWNKHHASGADSTGLQAEPPKKRVEA